MKNLKKVALMMYLLKIISNRLIIVFLLVGLLIFSLETNAQTPTTYTVKYHTSGNYTFPKVSSSQATIASTSPAVYIVGAGGAGYKGVTGGGGGGGGGASVKATGYNITSYSIPFTVGTGSTGNGAPSSFGNGEITANGGSAATGRTGANGAPASSTGAVLSSYGSVNVAASYKGGNGGEDSSGDAYAVGGAGGSGAGQSAAGNQGGKGNVLLALLGVYPGGECEAVPGGFSGAGGSGGSILTLMWVIPITASSGSKGSSGGGGGGGGAIIYVVEVAQGGEGGDGRAWVEVYYTYTGIVPNTPILSKSDDCYGISEETITISNAESDVQYTWYSATNAAGTTGRTQLKQGIGSAYHSLAISAPGYYFVEARRLDTTIGSLTAFSGANEISPYLFGSDIKQSAVVAIGAIPIINNLVTTFSCSSGAIGSGSFTGNIPSGTTYTWGTPTGATEVLRTTTGNNASSFTSGNLLNMGDNAVVVTYTVTPRRVLNGVTCIGDPFTVAITVPPSGLKLAVQSNVKLCPTEYNNDSITVNLNNYITESQGDLVFFGSVSGTDTIQVANAYKMGGNKTVYAQVSNENGCKTDRIPIVLNSYGMFANFAWDEHNEYKVLCLHGINLTKMVKFTKQDSYHIPVVEFYDHNHVLIQDPTNYTVTGPITVKMINTYSLSGCVYEETITFIETGVTEFVIQVSNQATCPNVNPDSTHVSYNLVNALVNVVDGVYFFYSDEEGKNLIGTYHTQGESASVPAELTAGLSTDFWVALGCVNAVAPTTPLVQFTVTVYPVPMIDISGIIWQCGTTAVNLTSVVSEIENSNNIVTGYKYATSLGSSSFTTISNPSNVSLVSGRYYYASVNNTVTNCTSNVLLPTSILPATITKTIAIRTDAVEVDLTKGVVTTAIPSAWISYYKQEEGNYILIEEPEQVQMPVLPNFYIHVENVACLSTYIPLSFRMINPNVTVRDSIICTGTSSISVSIQGLITLPVGARDYATYGSGNADSLIVYSDAAGTNVLGRAYLYNKNNAAPWSFTSSSSQYISFSYNEFGFKSVYVSLVQSGIQTDLSRITIARLSSTTPITKTIGVASGATEVNLRNGVLPTIPSDWVSYYKYEDDDYVLINTPEQEALPTLIPNFYAKLDNVPCLTDYFPLTIRQVNMNVATRDSLACVRDTHNASSIYIYNLITLPEDMQVYNNNNYPDSLALYSDAAGTDQILKTFLYYENYWWNNPSVYFDDNELGDKEVYVGLILSGVHTNLSKITVSRWPSEITKSITITSDITEVDLTQGLIATAIPSNRISYYKQEEGNYILIEDPELVTLPATPNYYVKVEDVPCLPDYVRIPIRRVNVNLPDREEIFCSAGTYIQRLSILSRFYPVSADAQDYYNNGLYNNGPIDSLFVYSDAAGTNLLGKAYLYNKNNTAPWSFVGSSTTLPIVFEIDEFATKEYYVSMLLGGIRTNLSKITITHNGELTVTFPSDLLIEAPKYTSTNILDYASISNGLMQDIQNSTIYLIEGTLIGGLEGKMIYLISDATRFDPANVYSIPYETLMIGGTWSQTSMPTGTYSCIVFSLNTLGCSATVNNSPSIKVVFDCLDLEIDVPETQPVEVCGYMHISSFVNNFHSELGVLSFALWNGTEYEPVANDKIPNELGTHKYEVTYTGLECPAMVKEIEFEVTKLGIDIQTSNVLYCDPAEAPVGVGVDVDFKNNVLSPVLNPEDENTVWRFYYLEGNTEINLPEGLAHLSDVALPDNFRLSTTVYLEYEHENGCTYTVPISLNIGASESPIPTGLYMDAEAMEEANKVFMQIIPGIPLIFGETKPGIVLDFSLLLSNYLPATTLMVNPVTNIADVLNDEDFLNNFILGDLSGIQEGTAIADPFAYNIPATPIQAYLIRVQNGEGCPSNPVMALLGTVGGLFIWQPSQDGSKTDDEMRDWNDATNWFTLRLLEFLTIDNLVPDAYSDVYIQNLPDTYYPDLTNTENAVCKNIYFAHGAELIRPDQLTYERAYVTLNFGLEDSEHPQITDGEMELFAFNSENPTLKLQVLAGAAAANRLSRNQWHQLSAPLGDMVTGDYSFGGFPATYLRKFSASATTTGTALVGNWTNYFTSTTAPLAPAEGFVLLVNDYRDRPLYREYGSGMDIPFGEETREYGLAQSNGLMVFPYYDIPAWSDAHHIHLFDEVNATSRFYGVNDREENLPLLNNYGTKERTAAADRFIFEQAAETPNVNYPVTAGDVVWADDTHHFALVGNPYLSSIDFDQFYADNSASIKNGFYLFEGDEYKTYSPEGSDLNRYIAPMQSFLVEMQESVQTANLSFQVENISLPREDVSFLRSSQHALDQLKITLSSEKGSSNAYLATRAYGSETVNQYDLAKLLSGIKAAPQVYTLKNTDAEATKKSALANHFIPTYDAVIPLGVATSTTGNMTFTLTGMDSYNTQITFIDILLNKEIEISGQAEFNYDFSYSPYKNNSGQVLANENRFFLRMANVPTGMDEVNRSILIYDANNDICIVASADNLIKQVLIADSQGRILYKNDSVGTASTCVRKGNDLPSVCVVKVITEHSMQTQKLVTK